MQKYMRSKSSYRFGNQSSHKWVMVVVALVMLAVGFGACKLLTEAGGSQTNYREKLQQEMWSEAKNAVNYVNKLSRNNGTSSDYQTLAQVRAYIHSLDELHSLYVAYYGEGRRIFTQEELRNVESQIELYLSNLTSGNKVTENLSTLQESTNALYTKTIEALSN